MLGQLRASNGWKFAGVLPQADRSLAVGWSSASGSGRSSRSPEGSCVTVRCCSCSTSRRRRSTPKPSTPCSSVTQLRRARAPEAAAASTPEGRITLLVSHRFSTVRMADFIVVLDGSRVVESGTHEALMTKRGQYAELYGIQAAAYR